MQDIGTQASAARGGMDFTRSGLRVRFRIGMVLSVLAILAYAFRHRLQSLDTAAIASAYEQVGPDQWIAALILTGVSFWAVGRYDRVIHRVLGTETPSHGAGQSGMIAIAIGQTVGFGVITGAFLRWRLRPELGLWQATRVSALVALSFMAGLATIAAGVVAITGLPTLPGARTIAALVLILALLLPILAMFPPAFLARFPLPPTRAMVRILILTLIDCGAAALALYSLLPADTALGFAPVLSAFLLALGAGIVTGTPGGVGPFEVVLLTLLPDAPQPSLIAAILAFRLVYYAVPAVMAAAFALLLELRRSKGGQKYLIPNNPVSTARLPRDRPLPSDVLEPLARAARAEAHLVRNTGLILLRNRRPLATLARSCGALVMLRDPWIAGRSGHTVLRDLRDMADARMETALFYKISGRLAVSARSAGWPVLAIAAEAWINPCSYSISTPERRRLRRKLRKAEAEGLRIRDSTDALPVEELAEIAADWSAAHRGERGFSMGRFSLEDLNTGLLYIAQGPSGRIEGFVTFHSVIGERTLDLMRYRPDAPDGTMHALVHHAITMASAENCPRLSLAAVTTPQRWLPGWVADRINRNSNTSGLKQFKAAFAPNWETLYAAAPGRISLLCGLASVFHQINIAGRMQPSKQRPASRRL